MHGSVASRSEVDASSLVIDTRSVTSNLLRSHPVTPTKFGFGKQFPKPFSLLSATQILRADDRFRQPSLFIIPTNWNLSNTDDLSYFLSIIVAVVYGKFAVIQFWQNL